MFFCQTFCSKKFSTAPLTLGFSQLISVGQKSSVTNSGVKRVIFENFTFYFAQTFSTVLTWLIDLLGDVSTANNPFFITGEGYNTQSTAGAEASLYVCYSTVVIVVPSK